VSRPKSLFALSLLAAAMSLPAMSFAEDEPFAFGPVPGWQIMVGPTLGGAVGDGSGFHLGAEASLNRLMRGYWVGGYADGAYEFGRGEALLTVGPQLGYTVFGLDAGLAIRSGGWTNPGVAARLLFTTGLFGLYGRYIGIDGDNTFQIGVLLKLPVWASAGD
jgi:hypothetical protein